MAGEKKLTDMLLTTTGLGYKVEFESTPDTLIVSITDKDHKEITDTRALIKARVTEARIVQGLKYLIHDLKGE